MYERPIPRENNAVIYYQWPCGCWFRETLKPVGINGWDRTSFNSEVCSQHNQNARLVDSPRIFALIAGTRYGDAQRTFS